jgi:hypothetical protein
LGKDFGWWGGGSIFHGNVNASQSRKNVSSGAAVNIPGPPSSSDQSNPILNAWLTATSPIDKAATWVDNHPAIVFPFAIVSALEGNEGPIEEDGAAIEQAVEEVIGAEGPAQGPYSSLIDITESNSKFTNFGTNVTSDEFKSALMLNGYQITSQSGSATVLSDGESLYTIYTRTSTGQAGAQYWGPNGIILKFSLGWPY